MKINSVLDKIDISENSIKNWKEKGLKITFPMIENKQFYKSDDGEMFIENADKFVPKMTNEEIEKYINSPKLFKEDFLCNVRLYKDFLLYLEEKISLIKDLDKKELLPAYLSVLYIFHSSMDNHYYHWDRYLAYENYPETPVGYWWKRLKQLCKKGLPHKEPLKSFLGLISNDSEIIDDLKNNLSKDDYSQLIKGLEALKEFEEAQQTEIDILTDNKEKIYIPLRVAEKILEPLWSSIKSSRNLVDEKNKNYINNILEGHPLIGARHILLEKSLRSFGEENFKITHKEISKWV